MELKILLTTDENSRMGQWFSLPSQAFERRLKWLIDQGIEPFVLDIMGDIPFEFLKTIKVTELNRIAEGLEALNSQILDNLETCLNYESLEELIDNDGKNFEFYDFDTMRDVASELTHMGEIENYIDPMDMTDYMDFEAMGRDIKSLFHFFELNNGEIAEYKGGA